MHTHRILVVMAALILGLTACGGEDAAVDEGSTTTAAPTTTAPTTTAAPTTTMAPTTTTTAPTTTTQPPPDPQALWDVYTAYFEAVVVGDWETARSFASGVAVEYVEMSREFQDISDQTGWVLESDTGPAADVVVLEDGRVAVGGTVNYTKENVPDPLTPSDPIFDVSGPEPLLSSWGANITDDRGDYSSMDARLLTLGEAGGACEFEALHAYDPLPSGPMERLLISIEVCPDSDWVPAEDAVTLVEVAGATTGGAPFLFTPGSPVPAGEQTVIVISFNVEEQALSSPMEISIQLPNGPQTFSVPPFRGG